MSSSYASCPPGAFVACNGTTLALALNRIRKAQNSLTTANDDQPVNQPTLLIILRFLGNISWCGLLILGISYRFN
jgi:hypothetical protein